MRIPTAIALLLFLTANASAADAPSDQVKAQVRRATGEYSLGQYLEAARDYEAAYLQTLDPNLLFNVAQAYRLAGDTDKSITAYRSFLRTDPHGDQRALAETKLRELEQKRASAPVAPASPAAPATAAAPAVTPTPTVLYPAPGPSAPMAGASPSSQTNMLVAAPPPSETPKSAAFYQRWPFWVGAGVVVAGAVVAVVLLSSRGDNLSFNNPTLGTKGF